MPLVVLSTSICLGFDKTAVVKLTSFDDAHSTTLEGSGFLFSYNDRIFVLSSDHVLFRDKQHQHRAWNEKWGELRAAFLFADWGRGISLLELVDPPSSMLASGALPSFSELKGAEHINEVPAITYGYPAQTQMLIQDRRGVANSVWMSTLMASNRQMAFLEGGYAEYGMSGGPVLLQDGRFLGILSHLLFWVQKRSTEEWNGQKLSPSLYVLIVPFAEIQGVLLEYLRRGTLEGVEFVQANEPTLRNQLKVACSHLQFDARLDDQGFLNSLEVAWKKELTITHFQTSLHEVSPYIAIEGILQSQGLASANVVGVREEDAFHYGSFQQVDISGLHLFIRAIEWSNIRAIFMFRKPEPAALKQVGSGFVKEIDAILAKRPKSEFWQERLVELRNAFQAAAKDPSSMAWTAAHPDGIREILLRAPQGEQLDTRIEKLLARVKEFTSRYLQ